MKKALIVISVIFLILAALIFVATLSSVGWDFTRLSRPVITNTQDINEDFDSISISANTADVAFVATDDGSVKVVCNEAYKITSSARVENGVLRIETQDTRRWYEMLSIIPRNFKITVYLPEGRWGSLNINTATGNTKIPSGFSFTSIDIKQSTGNIALNSPAEGNINLETSTGDITAYGIPASEVTISTSTGNISVTVTTANSLALKSSTGNISVTNAAVLGKIEVKSSTGKHNFTDISCISFESEANTGDAILTNVIASDRLSVKRSTGDVKLDSVDAAEIYIETDTGDVTGSLLSDKIFITRTDTGDIDVPRTTSGGVCEIETDTGNIKVSIQ